MDPVPTLGGYACGTGNPVEAGRSINARSRRGRRARLHDRAVHGRHRGGRADHADALRLVGRQGHGLHGQDDRRLPGRPRVQPRRIDPAHALSRRIRQATGVDGAAARCTRSRSSRSSPATTSRRAPAARRSSSSNFPRFDRNLNTGGRNYDESKGVVAHSAVHHSTAYPSSVTITVVRN